MPPESPRHDDSAFFHFFAIWREIVPGWTKARPPMFCFQVPYCCFTAFELYDNALLVPPASQPVDWNRLDRAASLWSVCKSMKHACFGFPPKLPQTRFHDILPSYEPTLSSPVVTKSKVMCILIISDVICKLETPMAMHTLALTILGAKHGILDSLLETQPSHLFISNSKYCHH